MARVQLPVFHSSEGLTIDILFRITTRLILNPKVLFPLSLYYSKRALRTSSSFQTKWSPLNLFRSFLSGQWSEFDRVLLTLMSLLVFGLMLSLNNFLSHQSRNNWKSKNRSDQFKWGISSSAKSRGEIVLITGGNGSVGKRVVDSLSAMKIAKIVVVDVVEPKERFNDNVTFYKCDLTSPSEIERVADKIKKEIGHPTVLINNAGIVRSRSILESTPMDVDLTYDVNVKSHFYTVKAFLPEMIKNNHGHVITIASCTAYIQAANGVSYASSKIAALSFHEGLTEELRHLYGATSVRTSIILPGHIHGPMFQGFDAGMPNWLMPSLKPETVAQLIVDIVLSEESQFVIEPFYCKVLPIVRALPAWLTDFMLSQAKNSMNKVESLVADRKTN